MVPTYSVTLDLSHNGGSNVDFIGGVARLNNTSERVFFSFMIILLKISLDDA
jgi:hypothetical protein